MGSGPGQSEAAPRWGVALRYSPAAGWLGFAARLVVGGTWIVAGALKLPHPGASVTAVRSYQLLPPDAAQLLGQVLPMLEVVLGACLVLGLLSRVSGVLSALLQLAFIIGIGSVWVRGISINCGCFGDGGANPDAIGRYPWEVARDVALMAGSLLVAWLPRTPLALDGLLFGATQKDHDVEEVS